MKEWSTEKEERNNAQNENDIIVQYFCRDVVDRLLLL